MPTKNHKPKIQLLKTPINPISKYSQECFNFKAAKHNRIYLNKILPTFVLPIMLVIIVIIGLIKNKKKLIYIAIGIIFPLSTPIF